jgi:release factor glutamine methyltransferase
MTIMQASKNLSNDLKKIYQDREAEKIADMIIENITGLTRSGRLINKEQKLTQTQQEKLKTYTAELLRHKPIQYVLHEAWFAGMKFYVDEHALIPRPETEELVEWIVKDANCKLQDAEYRPLSVLDIGTGSGCIAIALKKKLNVSEVYALDISEQALNISKKNAAENATDIQFIKADILNINKEIKPPRFDVIVSNPPYVRQNETSEMNANVLLYEPKLALFVPDDDALIFYKTIAEFALNHLNVSGKLYFEINELLSVEVTTLLKAKGFSEVIIKRDLQNKARMVLATFQHKK